MCGIGAVGGVEVRREAMEDWDGSAFVARLESGRSPPSVQTPGRSTAIPSAAFARAHRLPDPTLGSAALRTIEPAPGRAASSNARAFLRPAKPGDDRAPPKIGQVRWQVDVPRGGRDYSGLLARIRYVPLKRSDGVRGALYEDTPAARQRLATLCKRHPIAARFLFLGPKARVQALWAEALAPTLTDRARSHLARIRPDLSARTTVYRWQEAALIVLVLALGAWSIGNLPSLLIALNATFAAFYVFVGLVRLMACATPLPSSVRRRAPPRRLPDTALPTYSVLVPVYHEAAMVPSLIAALCALDYPTAKLDILILAEADDQATLDALAAQIMPGHIAVIKVPTSEPRTKPKALNFALPLTRGQLLTIYDAEDRPEPDQLRKAVQAFVDAEREGGKPLGCVQAALTITNAHRSFFTRHFALEYMALFDALLPALSQLDLPIPLGGTSNHFRRDALLRAGGWDPYNVTEDADLGIRLARLGYRTQMIASSTLEQAPVRFGDWIRQRARWFKGWWQTWLVHMRYPLTLAGELGPGGFTAFHIILLGVLVSVLIHPFFALATLAALLGVATPLFDGANGGLQLLAALNVINFFLGYVAAAALGLVGARRRGVKRLAFVLATIPIYWLFLSLAGFLALWDLAWRPHHWHKTPHGVDEQM